MWRGDPAGRLQFADKDIYPIVQPMAQAPGAGHPLGAPGLLLLLVGVEAHPQHLVAGLQLTIRIQPARGPVCMVAWRSIASATDRAAIAPRSGSGPG